VGGGGFRRCRRGKEDIKRRRRYRKMRGRNYVE